MKKLFYLLSALVFTIGTVACDKTEEEAVLPSIMIGADSLLSVPAEGGDYIVTYTLSNSVSGGRIFAVPSADWISGINCDTLGKVAFHVDGNTGTQVRNASVTLTYEYGSGSAVNAEIGLSQAAVEPIEYDYVLEAGYFDGLYYGQEYSVNYNYYAWVSSEPWDNGDFFVQGGIYYVFDIYVAEAPEDENNPEPVTGVYTLGEPGSTQSMTFSMDQSRRCYSVDFETTEYLYFTEGTLTVSKDGDVWTYEASLKDTNGDMHHVVYNGAAPYTNDLGDDEGIKRLDRDISTVAISASGSYMGGNDEVMEINLQLQDMAVGVWHGTKFVLDVFMTYDEDGNIENGTYTLTRDNGTPKTMVEGIINEEMQFPYPTGSYAQYYDENSDAFLGLFDSGTMEVSGDAASGYDITFDFLTVEGYSVHCTYSGPLSIIGIPGPYSTLTEDHTLDLSEAEATAYFYGDYYLTGGNWVVNLIGPDEGLTMEIVADTLCLDFAEGIPTGTYVPCRKSYFGPWEYQPGSMSYEGDLSGTNYLADFEGDYGANEYAPATSGDLNITNHGDGTYTVSFAFLDDKEHTWDGEWTGTIEMVDMSAGIGAPIWRSR